MSTCLVVCHVIPFIWQFICTNGHNLIDIGYLLWNNIKSILTYYALTALYIYGQGQSMACSIASYSSITPNNLLNVSHLLIILNGIISFYSFRASGHI